MDDFVVNVRQIAQYPFATVAAPADAILLQQGGVGGDYVYTNPAGLVDPVIAQQITTAAINLSDSSWIKWGASAILQANASSGLSFAVGGSVLFGVDPLGNAKLPGTLTVGGDPTSPLQVSTKQYVDAGIAAATQLLTNSTVWTVNGKNGNVNLTWADLIAMGGAPITSPAFQGTPTVPSITNDNQYDWQIANTAFVQDVVNCRINALLHAHPFVWSFNGRIGDITLTTDDINAAYFAPGASLPRAPTPALYDASTRIATTMFVDDAISDVKVWTQSEIQAEIAAEGFAPLASPQFSGLPTAPTAAPATATAQLATTAYVMNAVAASTAGVASFNGRTGIVDLENTDITNAGGALLVSPVFTGTPQAPTATSGTDTGQIATCAFVLNEMGGASIGVMSFNGRGGAVVLAGADITGAGGALLAGPAFSGVPTAPTAATGVATQQLATTAFVAAAISALSIGVSSFNSRTGAVTLTANDVSAAGGAVLASPAFTGTPTAPTAAPSTSTTQLATTAFVTAAIAAAPSVSSFNSRAGAVTLNAADVNSAGGVTTSVQSLTAAQQTQARQNVYAAPFDALAYNGMQVNGSCDVDQAHAGAAVSISGAETYVVDGFSVNFSGVPVGSAQQVTDAPPGLISSLKLSVTTAQPSIASSDVVYIVSKIEGYRTARVALGTSTAQPVSFGFWVKANRPGTYSGAMVNGTNNRSYAFPFTINSSLTWEFKTVTIPGDVTGAWANTNATGLRLYICMAAGSGFVGAANVWVGANQLGVTGTINGVAATTDTFQITGLISLPGIELPSAARAPFIMRPFGQELLTCQRYWQPCPMLPGVSDSTSTFQCFGSLYPSMRATPILGIVGGTITQGIVMPGFGYPDITGISINVNGSRDVFFSLTTSAITAGTPGGIFYSTSSNKLTLDARL